MKTINIKPKLPKIPMPKKPSFKGIKFPKIAGVKNPLKFSR